MSVDAPARVDNGELMATFKKTIGADDLLVLVEIVELNGFIEALVSPIWKRSFGMLKGSCCFLLLAAIQRVSGMAVARETREIRRWAYPVFPTELCCTTGGATGGAICGASGGQQCRERQPAHPQYLHTH